MLAIAAAGSSAVLADAPIYYVSASGSDSNNGLSPSAPWASVAQVNAASASFVPGTEVLFERGDTWSDSLAPLSDGTAAAPIIYGSYGDTAAANPTFFGSDIIPNDTFAPVSATTYVVSESQSVGSVYVNHNFLQSAALLDGGGSGISYVEANPDTWYYDPTAGQLYVNSGANPQSDGQLYTAAVRQNAVITNGHSYLTFDGLSTDETATSDAGYGFKINGGTNITLENCAAYRAGKHAIGVIDSTNFTGANLYAATLMPDQGYGGASPYVFYADPGYLNMTGTWTNITTGGDNPQYPAFITHGPGVASVTVTNLVTSGSDGFFAGADLPAGSVHLIGGTLTNAPITIYSNGAVVDGVTLNGPGGQVVLYGNDDILQNSIVSGSIPYDMQRAAVISLGLNNTIRFNTITLDPSADYVAALSVTQPDSGTNFYGNIVDSPSIYLWLWNGATMSGYVDNNLLEGGTSTFDLVDNEYFTLAQWQALGNDLATLTGDPDFADAADGDYALLVGSPAIDAFTPAQWQEVLSDLLGNARPEGMAVDLGAIEEVAPEPSSLALLAAGTMLLIRRRRARAR